MDVLQADALSSTYVRKFKTKNGFATAFGLVGGAFIGFPVGQAIGGGDPVWEVALIGVGALAIAIPLSVSANKDIE